MTNPLLPPNIVKQIPVEFVPLLISGYHIPISYFQTPPSQIIPESEIDSFLDKYPEYVGQTEQNGEIIKIINKNP